MLLKRLAAIVVLLVLVGAACGKDEPSVDTGSPAGDHNTADVEFAQGMIPHHQQAVEMADMALEKAADPAIKDLATRIKRAQGPEITAMTGWLEGWGEKADGGGHGTGMDMSGGMMSAQEMGELERSSGAVFDRLFLTMMTRHHQGAIEMAKAELTDGKYPPAKDLATQITTSQQAEIEEMAGLLAATTP